MRGYKAMLSIRRRVATKGNIVQIANILTGARNDPAQAFPVRHPTRPPPPVPPHPHPISTPSLGDVPTVPTRP